jgi:hypothetical protein
MNHGRVVSVLFLLVLLISWSRESFMNSFICLPYFAIIHGEIMYVRTEGNYSRIVLNE